MSDPGYSPCSATDFQEVTDLSERHLYPKWLNGSSTKHPVPFQEPVILEMLSVRPFERHPREAMVGAQGYILSHTLGHPGQFCSLLCHYTAA